MGQLEKYGLYVLCLVIFMILGVALWGDPATAAAERGSRRDSQAPISAPGTGGTKEATKGARSAAFVDLDGLLDPSRGKGSQPGPVTRGGETGSGVSPVKAVTPAGEQPKSEPDTKRPVYAIKAGDSFDSIARTQLKDAGLRDLLIQLNPDVSPTRMRLGKEIVLPSPAEIAARKPAPVTKDPDAGKVADPKSAAVKAEPLGKGEQKAIQAIASAERFYTVQKGDTFERIANVELGSKKRTAELMALNAGIAPTALRKGQRIKLPKQ